MTFLDLGKVIGSLPLGGPGVSESVTLTLPHGLAAGLIRSRPSMAATPTPLGSTSAVLKLSVGQLSTMTR